MATDQSMTKIITQALFNAANAAIMVVKEADNLTSNA